MPHIPAPGCVTARSLLARRGEPGRSERQTDAFKLIAPLLNARLEAAQLLGLNLRADIIDTRRKRYANGLAETPLYRLGSRLDRKKACC